MALQNSPARLVARGEGERPENSGGYGDQYFFSKDFKRFTGLPPTEFRKRKQGTV